jgi:hypothetical protein
VLATEEMAPHRFDEVLLRNEFLPVKAQQQQQALRRIPLTLQYW